MQNEGTGADREDGLAALGLVGDEANQGGVVHLLARAFAAGHQQIVKRRTFVEGDVGIDRHALGAHDRLAGLRHHETPFGSLQVFAPERNHLPRTDEIQFLQTWENQKTKVHEVMVGDRQNWVVRVKVGVVYSARSATVGLTFVARRAGR